MGLYLNREKKRIYLLSIIYRLSKVLFFFNVEQKLKLYLELEWIFDRLAHEESFNYYNDNLHPLRVNTINFIKKHVNQKDNIIDLGCKFGEMSNALSEFSKKVIGIDYELKNIEMAKSKYKKPNLEFIHDDAFNYLQNYNQKHDVIILSHILEHIDDPLNFLIKCKKLTKAIFIELPDYDKSYLNHYRKDAKSELNYTDVDHIWEFDREELISLIKDANLKIIDCEFRFGVIKIWCETSEN